jgi:hypothetical protein
MWEPQPLATLGASTACNRDIFRFPFLPLHRRLSGFHKLSGGNDEEENPSGERILVVYLVA